MFVYQLSEATAAQRRVPLHLVDATDGITPETGEAAGQPQLSKNGAAFGNTTATLVAVANGLYYVELTAAELDTLGFVAVRYKSAATAEAQVAGQVVAYDPYAVMDVAAVKTKTDQLVFTVANQVDSNVLDWKSATAPAMTGDAFARLGAPAGASVSADVAAVKVDTAAVKVQTDKLTFTVANQIDANVLDWKSATAPAMTGDAFARLGAPVGVSISADVAAVKANAVTIIADTDDIQTRIPAALVGGRIDASVGAMAAGVVTAAAVGTGAIDADALAADAGNKIADATLRRTYANARASADGDAVAFRSLLGAVGKLVNKWSISGSTLTIFQEDDATSTAPGGTQTVSGTAGADPITALDT